LLKLGPHQVLVDAYNSNPQSAAAALRLAAELPVTGKRILVAGSMLELGDYSREAHEQLGREVTVAGIQSLITVGEEARAIRNGARSIRQYIHVRTAADVIVKLKPWLSTGGDLIVVKGSRGIGLEKVVDDLKQRFKV
jgi:UDP-N-acetylmuramoyl-tripeptide--D-alanyl-D-alanine ligase